MSEYTAEDFAQANLATKGRFEVARRTDPRDTHQWHAHGGKQGCFSDEEMAAGGWVPVVEPRGTDDTLRHVEERAIPEPRHDLAVARKGREPWADLADALRGTVWERLSGDVDGLAAAVHAAGWRKGGETGE